MTTKARILIEHDGKDTLKVKMQGNKYTLLVLLAKAAANVIHTSLSNQRDEAAEAFAIQVLEKLNELEAVDGTD